MVVAPWRLVLGMETKPQSATINQSLMDKFLPTDDELGKLIQGKAENLYQLLQQVPLDNLGMPAHCLEYFKGSHFKRLFFSIQTSAHLLYRSIKMIGKAVDEIIIMDYGAGVGTLYTLAKMIGCRKVIYNDHLPDWQLSAKLIAEAIGVQVDEYIVGDIEATLQNPAVFSSRIDIITSRNVLEHIYNLSAFFTIIRQYQPQSLVFSSTTANNNNPGSRIKHHRWHNKWEKHYRQQRFDLIKQELPSLSIDKANELAGATRGLAVQDLKRAIEDYSQAGTLPDPSIYGTNTCDPDTGVWAENLLPYTYYHSLGALLNYKVTIEPGFWDTHYQSGLKNLMGNTLNSIMLLNKTIGYALAPFIYVIAKPGQ